MAVRWPTLGVPGPPLTLPKAGLTPYVQHIGEDGLRGKRGLLRPRTLGEEGERERPARFFFQRSGCSVSRIVATDICMSIRVPMDEPVEPTDGLRSRLLVLLVGELLSRV